MPVYTLRGVEVRFPHEAYPCQLDYMSRVIEALQQGQNALLESPTGTGKTLCLLCAALAWRESLKFKAEAHVGEVQLQQHSSHVVQGLREAYAELNAEKARAGVGLPAIIYSSRTHSQLQQVMRELRNTEYRPNNALLSSRQQTCLNPSVSSLVGVAANRACRALVGSRACKWHLNVERYLKKAPETLQEVLDIEELVKFGQSRVLCPYYMGREMAKEADILFLPYNYLMDSKFRTGLGINWERAVIIFDEAHNVEGVCSDSASFDLPAPVLAGCIVEVGTAAELALSRSDGPDNVVNEFGVQEKGATYAGVATQLRQLQMVLQRLEAEIAALPVEAERGLTRPGAFIFDLLAKINLTPDTYLVMSSLLETAMELLTNAAIDAGRSSGARSSSYRLNALDEALRLAFASASNPADPAAPPPHLGYRVHVHLEKARDGRMLPTLSYWCFSPGQTMAQLALMKVGSILLTSGTLSPMDSFAAELGLPFPVRLENPHVIDPSQVWVGVVPVGPSGHALNSSYQNRDNKSYKDDLGHAIVNFARIVPDGLLVFFPSYGQLKACMDAWKAVGPGGACTWDRITKHKAAVVEPRDSALFPQAAEDFKAKLTDPSYRGAVFFAVCRGKVSEGLDFSDRAGRAVVITGIPYATKTDPKVCIKQDLLNEQLRSGHKRPRGSEGADAPGLSGSAWYSQQAMRAVNQAMGRVIRHRRDYGAIILCDERFQAERTRVQLSKWLRDGVVAHPTYGSAASSLTQFFKRQAENARQGLVSDGGQAPVRGAGGPDWASAGGGGPFANAVDRRDGRAAGPPRALASVPLAMDVVGLTDLLVVAAGAPASGSQDQQQSAGAAGAGGSRLMSALSGRPGSQQAQQARQRSDVDDLLAALGSTAQQGQQAQQASGGGAAGQGQPKPWEKVGLPAGALLRPNAAACPPAAPRAPSVQPAAGGQLSNAVGPAHLIQRHQQAQRAQQAGAAGTGAAGSSRSREGTPAPTAAEPSSCSGGDSIAKAASSSRGGSEGGGKGGGKGSGSGAQEDDRQAERIRSFLAQLKKQLPPEAYGEVLAALRRYKKDNDREALGEAALRALGPPDRAHLLPALARFFPAEARGAFEERIRPYVAAAAQPQVPAAAAGAGGSGSQGPPVAITNHHASVQLPWPPQQQGQQPQQQGGKQQQQQQQQQQRAMAAHAAAAAKLFGPPAGTAAAAVGPQHRPAGGQWGQGGGRPGPPAAPAGGFGAAGPSGRQGGQWQSGQAGHCRASGPPQPGNTTRGPNGGIGTSGAFAAGGGVFQQRQNPSAAGGGPMGRPGGGGAATGGMGRGQWPGPEQAAAAAAGRRPPQQQQQQQQQRGLGGGLIAPGVVPGALPPPPRVGATGGPKPAATGTVPTTTLAKCAACGKAPMEAPHVATCGAASAACYPCWLKALALMKCHGCGKKHTKSQLSKMYFK